MSLCKILYALLLIFGAIYIIFNIINHLLFQIVLVLNILCTIKEIKKSD